MKRTDEKGVALILVMIMLAVLSIIAASLMSISRSETYASMNYRLMSLARYGGESAVHKASNYLMYTYVPPPTGPDPIGNYNMSVTPVTYLGQPVVLSSDSGTASNYPVAATVTAFQAGASGTLTGGTSPVSYGAVATLVSMRQINVFGGTPAVVQTWQISGKGSLSGSRPAQVEVSSIFERQVVPTFRYAAFATDAGCGALTWSGGGNTDSYDSTVGLASVLPTGGNVGTNGNLDVNGAMTVIQGSLSTPRSGVGGCAAGAVTAMTGPGSAVTEGLVELPQAVTYPPPAPPNPPPPSGPTGDFTVNNAQNLTRGPGIPLTPACPNPYSSQVCYGDIVIKGTLHLTAGTYNINRLTMNAGGALIIDSGPVVMNVAGYATPGNPSVADATPVNLTGGSLTTSASLDPTMFQLMYAGSGDIKMAGGSSNAGLIYAPNALVENLSNGADWYGAVIGRKVKDSGAASIHYDRQLQKKMMTLGAYMLDSFTWKKQ